MRIAKLLVAAAFGAAAVLPAAAPASAILPPQYYYAGPYATQAACQAEQQTDPDAAGPCLFRTGSNPGWFYRARIF